MPPVSHRRGGGRAAGLARLSLSLSLRLSLRLSLSLPRRGGCGCGARAPSARPGQRPARAPAPAPPPLTPLAMAAAGRPKGAGTGRERRLARRRACALRAAALPSLRRRGSQPRWRRRRARRRAGSSVRGPAPSLTSVSAGVGRQQRPAGVTSPPAALFFRQAPVRAEIWPFPRGVPSRCDAAGFVASDRCLNALRRSPGSPAGRFTLFCL